MRELLIAEMKRAIEILESKPELQRKHKVQCWGGTYDRLDRELVELVQLNKSIRRHSVSIEKHIHGQQGW